MLLTQIPLEKHDIIQDSAFEAHCSHYRHIIHHSHCDNGQIADDAILLDAPMNKQSISFCSVNAHFQNGIAEKAFAIFKITKES